jgi:hypothetical protein
MSGFPTTLSPHVGGGQNSRSEKAHNSRLPWERGRLTQAQSRHAFVGHTTFLAPLRLRETLPYSNFPSPEEPKVDRTKKRHGTPPEPASQSWQNVGKGEGQAPGASDFFSSRSWPTESEEVVRPEMESAAAPSACRKTASPARSVDGSRSPRGTATLHAACRRAAPCLPSSSW